MFHKKVLVKLETWHHLIELLKWKWLTSVESDWQRTANSYFKKSQIIIWVRRSSLIIIQRILHVIFLMFSLPKKWEQWTKIIKWQPSKFRVLCFHFTYFFLNGHPLLRERSTNYMIWQCKGNITSIYIWESSRNTLPSNVGSLLLSSPLLPILTKCNSFWSFGTVIKEIKVNFP